LREEAKKIGSPDLRKEIEEIARQYDLLAESVGKEAK
jgi:hypothetical protein